jgi:hypothetical protein
MNPEQEKDRSFRSYNDPAWEHNFQSVTWLDSPAERNDYKLPDR